MMQLTIIGFGNQARSWALNLKDSAFPVRVALRKDSPSFLSANESQIETVQIDTEEFYNGEAFALLTPDHTHYDFMMKHAHRLRPGALILYAHGYSLLKQDFEKKFPQLRHVLFAPKSIGSELRRQYQLKGKLGAVFSLEHVNDGAQQVEAWLMELARALGINMGPYKTSFKNETEADLYSEQGLLCSLIPYTAAEMFRHLIENGTEPELAYFEVWHELKLIINAMVDKGPEGFFDLISPNALIGSEKGYQRLLTSSFTSNLKSLLDEIRSGEFDKEIVSTNVEGLRENIRTRWRNEPLNQVFNKITKQEPK